MKREIMEFDVVIVGGGPAGLACAIRLAQLGQFNICLIDKGAHIGSHLLSGAVLDPRSLNELIPGWQEKNPPLHTPAIEDEFLFLTENKSFRLPTPPPMNNHGNYIISLDEFGRFLAEYAESLGVNIFPSFAATEIIYENDTVCGVITGDKGVDRFGKPKPSYQPGIELRAKQVIFAEGCCGSLTETLIKRFNLRDQKDPQTYAIGIKEVWEVPDLLFKSGAVKHSIGWPLDFNTYGGSFQYHFGKNLVAIGFVIGLDYKNPYLNPYEEFQRYKTHPSVYPLLAGGQRIAYGARTLIEGGLQCLPKLSVKGGLIIGDAAGFLNVPKIKGIHNAIKSGMVAAESLAPLLLSTTPQNECVTYQTNLEKSWLWEDLYKVRNIRPAMRLPLPLGLAYSAIDTYLLRGHAPWTFHHRVPDYAMLKKAKDCNKIDYPKHDQIVTFDLLTSLDLANVEYIEDQPYHLILADRHRVPIEINLDKYDSPESRYCPASVYEIIYNEKNEPRLMINGGNCIHCKACVIKDPTQNITWTPSEGGSGPNYTIM